MTVDQQFAAQVLRIVKATDLPPLPEDGSESLDLAIRHVLVWQEAEVERLQAEAAKSTDKGDES